MRRALLSSLFSVGVAALLSRCGIPMCVAGVGDCNLDIGKQRTQQTVQISTETPSVAAGGQAILTATGGQAPYTWTLINTPAALAGQLDTTTKSPLAHSTVIWNAPLGTSFSMPSAKVIFQATDNLRAKSNQLTITVHH